MVCDRCKKDFNLIQKFHKPYADYCKLNQVNGFCHDCWNKIVSEHGTWLDICVNEAVKPFIKENQDSFDREYKSIWISSSEVDN